MMSLTPYCMFADANKTLMIRQFIIGSTSTNAPKDRMLVCTEWGGGWD